MRRRATRKTDFGTIIFHWLLVALLAILVVTGLRIAAESPDRAWLLTLDNFLPKDTVWTAHIPVGVGLFSLAVAYATYVSKAALGRRIRLDRARLIGLFRRGQTRWGAINVALYWALFFILLSQIITGGLLYFGYGGKIAALHLFGTWGVIVFPAAHVAVHWVLGGWPQLLRIFRPMHLPPPAPPFDPMDLLALTDSPLRERAPSGSGMREEKVINNIRLGCAERHLSRCPNSLADRSDFQAKHRPRQRGTVVQANAFMVAVAVGVTAMTGIIALDQGTRDTLQIRRITKGDIPVLDGDISESVWREARPVIVLTQQGGNFDGTGETKVEIRAVHDGERAYFSFVWNDPTRSLKHLPLVKTAQGWHLLQGKFAREDEDSYFEDKFAVLLTTANVLIPGDRTFHSGRAPLAAKPATFSGRGLHYTTDGSIVDVWEWKATSSGSLGFMDDDYFGPPAEPNKKQVEGRTPYKGGFRGDPGTVAYAENFERPAIGEYQQPLRPRRLPKNWQKARATLGKFDFNPRHSESEIAQWFMTAADSEPYSSKRDTQIPVGTIIPGVIITGKYSGDRADVRCAARWAAGSWTLEVERRLQATSRYDVPITSGIFMRVAAFDHAQSHHTRAIRPILLELE